MNGMSRTSVLRLFIAVVAMGGLAVLAAAGFRWQDDDMGLIVALAGLAVICELLDFGTFPNSRVSLSVGAIVAAAVVGSFTGIAIVCTAAVGAQYLAHRKPLFKVAFNEGALLVSGAAVVGVFEAFGTGFAARDWPDVMAPALVAGVVYFAINSGLVAVAISIDKGINPVSVWSDAFSWLAPHYVLVSLLAVAVATAFDAWGLVGIALPLVPLAMAWIIVKQYADRAQPADAAA